VINISPSDGMADIRDLKLVFSLFYRVGFCFSLFNQVPDNKSVIDFLLGILFPWNRLG
jgi:hypothetical protein